MLRIVFRTLTTALPLLLAAQAIAAPPQSPAAPPAATAAAPTAGPAAAFTDSTAAGLAATRRVAITSVIVSFQASTGARAGAHFFVPMLTSRKEVQTVLALPNMSPQLQSAIADAAYKALAAELTAAGYEVVPEAQVKASASYQAIQQQAGFSNNSRFANAMGDVLLASPASLPPYTPYNGEVGNFYYPSTTYLGWISGFGGNSTTPGGLSITRQSNAWKVPGLEVALAKELNANVVKATYVVSLGKAEAGRSTNFSTSEHSGFFTYQGSLYAGNYRTLDRTVTGTGSAFAQVGMIADQTHISFRTPGGNAKWQKVSMIRIPPAKDGDVVVRITEPVMGSTDFFNIQEGDIARSGGLFSAQQRGDINVGFIASIANEAGYGAEVSGMIDAANKAMIGLIRPQ
jgi:hypothetical protein